MEWLNEISQRECSWRLLAALPLWSCGRPSNIYLDNRDHCHEHKMRVAYLGKF
jgi:hypothetical protein